MSAPTGAIETLYKGVRFRSRVEARWAVWLDAMSIPWSYEQEGYSDGGRAYLPDFDVSIRRPEFSSPVGVFLEIKGYFNNGPESQPSPDEIAKAKMLAKITGRVVYIAFGSFSSGYKTIPTPVMISVDPKGRLDGLLVWRHCTQCDTIVPVSVKEGRLPCNCEYPFESAQLQRAYVAARAARFGVHE